MWNLHYCLWNLLYCSLACCCSYYHTSSMILPLLLQQVVQPMAIFLAPARIMLLDSHVHIMEHSLAVNALQFSAVAHSQKLLTLFANLAAACLMWLACSFLQQTVQHIIWKHIYCTTIAWQSNIGNAMATIAVTCCST